MTEVTSNQPNRQRLNSDDNRPQITRKKMLKYSFLVTDIIGKGFSSIVYRGRNDQTLELVAIKVINSSQIEENIHKDLLRSEVSVLRSIVKTEGLLNVCDIYSSASSVYIITQLCQQGDLARLIKSTVVTQEKAVCLMNQIISAYKELYARRIVHRDLKPSNIFLTKDHIRIADFGFALVLAPQVKQFVSAYNVGSPLYMPPQALQNSRYSFKSDIWALGAIFFELLVGRTPWKATSEVELIAEMEAQPIQKIIPDFVSAANREFLIASLTQDYDKRITPEKLFEVKFNCIKIVGTGTHADIVEKINWIDPNANVENMKEVTKMAIAALKLEMENHTEPIFRKLVIQSEPQPIISGQKENQILSKNLGDPNVLKNPARASARISKRRSISQASPSFEPNNNNHISPASRPTILTKDKVLKEKKQISHVQSVMKVNYKENLIESPALNQRNQGAQNKYKHVSTHQQIATRPKRIKTENSKDPKLEIQKPLTTVDNNKMPARVYKVPSNNLRSPGSKVTKINKKQSKAVEMCSSGEAALPESCGTSAKFAETSRPLKSSGGLETKDKIEAYLSQVHFCRFIFKLTTMLLSLGEESHDATDCMEDGKLLVELGTYLLFKIKSLIDNVNKESEFAASKDGKSILSVLKKYKEKYEGKLNEIVLDANQDRYENLKIVLTQFIHALHGKLKKKVNNLPETSALVLDLSVTLRQLTSMDKNQSRTEFKNKSNIDMIVNGKNDKSLDKQFFETLTKKMKAIRIL